MARSPKSRDGAPLPYLANDPPVHPAGTVPVGGLPGDILTKLNGDFIDGYDWVAGSAGGGMTQDQADARYVALAGSQMSGPLGLSGNPQTALHATPKGYVDAPTDGLVYARQGASWVPAIFTDSFTWSVTYSVTGNEPVGTVPQQTWLIPPSALPATPFQWMAAGTGIGAFFVSNQGLSPQSTAFPGNQVVSLESPVGSGDYYDIATITTGTNLSQTNSLLRLAPITAQANRLWSYNPASAGIRFGLRYTGAGNNNGVAVTLIIGLQGHIMAPSLNRARGRVNP